MAIAAAAKTFCLRNDVKVRAGMEIGDTSQDQIIDDIIRGIANLFENYCNRIFILNTSDATEYYDGGVNVIIVKRYPIVSITSVTESTDYDWDNETALTANDGYRSTNDKGIIHRLASDFYCGRDIVRIVYTGGYVAPGCDVGSGETALPDDLREAAIKQARYELKRKDDLGLSAVSAMGTNITKYAEDDLLPIVKRTLNHYRRWIL